MSAAEHIPVVRSSAFWPVVAELGRMGVPLERHLAAAGVPEEALDFPDLVVPERAFWALLDGVRREGSEDIGFRIGASHRVTDVPGLHGPLSGHLTLLETMRAFCTLLGCHSSVWDYWIEPAPGGVRLCRLPSPVTVGQWPVEQYVVSYLVDLVRMAAPPGWWPREVWLSAGHRPIDAERRWLQDARLHYDSPFTAILVPDSVLGLRAQVPPGVDETEASDCVLHRDFVPNLRTVLRAYVPENRVRLRDIGDVLGLHPRTLQRRLKDLGTSFQKTLDEARFELACDRLREGLEPLVDIADQLGYGEHAAFTKAFRRWAGVSPSRYRQLALTGSLPGEGALHR